MLGSAYGESVLSKTHAYEWYKDFPRSDRLSTSSAEENIDEVREMVF